jgi:hypothetical protein
MLTRLLLAAFALGYVTARFSLVERAWQSWDDGAASRLLDSRLLPAAAGCVPLAGLFLAVVLALNRVALDEADRAEKLRATQLREHNGEAAASFQRQPLHRHA